MNKASYTNLAKEWEFVENRSLSRQSERLSAIRRQADDNGFPQGSAAQGEFLRMLVRMTNSDSVIVLGAYALVETFQLIDALDELSNLHDTGQKAASSEHSGRMALSSIAGRSGGVFDALSTGRKAGSNGGTAQAAGQLTAVDSSAQGIEAIRRLFADLSDHTQTSLRAVNAPADSFLPRLNAGVYQLIVIAGDTANYHAAFNQAARLLSKGGVIAFTDIMAFEGKAANGGLVNPADRSDKAVFMRQFLEIVQSDERFVSTLTSIGTGLLMAIKI